MTRQELFETEAKVPKATRSYTPLSNEVFIQGIQNIFTGHGLEFESDHYSLGAKGQQMFGYMSFKGEGDILKTVGFRNSYNKSIPAGLACGGRVIVCSNLMFTGDIIMIRKHTSNLFNDLDNMVNRAYHHLVPTFDKIVEDSERLKVVEVDRDLASKLVGDMLFKDEILSPTETMEFIRHYRDKAVQLPGQWQTAWDIMNHITEALKKEHASTRIPSQIRAHTYVTDYFNL